MIPTETARIVAVFERHGGNVSAAARELGISRSSVRRHAAKAGATKKPLVAGNVKAVAAPQVALPPSGIVQRYIITSAQNNTKLNDRVWNNLLALAEHYDARLLVGTYSYNQNAYGKLAVKRGTKKEYDSELWYDERLTPYISDSRLELANGLVWCGEMNILPTAIDPLGGLETYSHRKSSIFPHAKFAMRSIATMMGEGAKLNYTTGTVTQRNYIQKRAGLVADHHHSYGALIVEVNDAGHWWLRQLDADDTGRIHDLNVVADFGKVIDGQRIEAITWGDIHASTLDHEVAVLALGDDGMLDVLRPRFQFIHDLLNAESMNHHESKNPHASYKRMLRGYHVVESELKMTAQTLRRFHRPWAETIVVDSNHDSWFMKWLREHDYRSDPLNAEVFLEAQLQVYRALKNQDGSFNLVEWAMERFGAHRVAKFLNTDESFTICKKRIECGMHGHLGPDGARGSAKNLAKVGRRSNVGHSHSAGIFDGLYQAGTSTTLDMGYNKGPSSWTHSHIVTYPNGKRTIITMYGGRWRA